MSASLVPAFLTIYAIAFIILVAVEFYAIGRPGKGDTISEHFWTLRRSSLVWAAVPAVTWVFFHFVLPWEPDGVLVNDLFYIGVGVLIAAWNVIYQRKKGES